IFALLLQLLDLFLRQPVEAYPFPKELRCMFEDLEGREIAVLHGLLQIVICSRQLPLAVKKAERASCDEIDRRCSKSDLMAVEIVEDVAVNIIDAAVRLVGNDQIEEPRIE